MYEVGQKVVYGIHGVCCITDMEEKTVDRRKIPYFVLEPLEQPGTRYYVPSQNQAAISKIRPLMDAKTLQAMLTVESMGNDWISDENKRKQYYREIINGVNSPALIRMVHALYQHKREQIVAGRKMHQCDENFLRDAQRVLGSEISIVLQIPPSEVPAYIQNCLEK